MRFAVLLCTVALSGCTLSDKPEITACEYMAREGLSLPQHYKRLSATSYHEALTGGEMEELRASVPAIMGGRPGILVAAIEFEYRTNAGGIYNGAKICQFPTRDGEPIGGGKGMMHQAKGYVALVRAGVKMQSPVAGPKF